MCRRRAPRRAPGRAAHAAAPARWRRGRRWCRSRRTARRSPPRPGKPPRPAAPRPSARPPARGGERHERERDVGRPRHRHEGEAERHPADPARPRPAARLREQRAGQRAQGQHQAVLRAGALPTASDIGKAASAKISIPAPTAPHRTQIDSAEGDERRRRPGRSAAGPDTGSAPPASAPACRSRSPPPTAHTGTAGRSTCWRTTP